MFKRNTQLLPRSVPIMEKMADITCRSFKGTVGSFTWHSSKGTVGYYYLSFLIKTFGY